MVGYWWLCKKKKKKRHWKIYTHHSLSLTTSCPVLPLALSAKRLSPDVAL
jgi:hypothetical protein